MNRQISDLFSVEYPKTMIFQDQEIDPAGFPFVSSAGENNGIVGKIKQTANNKLYRGGAITVPLKGSVLDAFYQPNDFYIAHQIAVLYPKRPMSEKELLFYCLCIRKNKFRFSYGRQADLTLKDLKIPAYVPKKFLELDVEEPSAKPFSNKKLAFTDRKWNWFGCGSLFEIEYGQREYTSKDILDLPIGGVPLISSTGESNGVYGFYDIQPKYSHVLSIARTGSVGATFYHNYDCCINDDCMVLSLIKEKLNIFRGLFLCYILGQEKYRYSYARKVTPTRMRESKIKLPVDKSGVPDWQFMENYIKSLPYSGAI